MADDDPRAVAVIDADNQAADVLRDAISDYRDYASTVRQSAGQVAFVTNNATNTVTRSYKTTVTQLGEAIQVTKDYTETLQQQVVPAYNHVIDVQSQYASDQAALGHVIGQTNSQMEQQAKHLSGFLDKFSQSGILSASLKRGVQGATGSHAAGVAAGTGAELVMLKQVVKESTPLFKAAMKDYHSGVQQGISAYESAVHAAKSFNDEALRTKGAIHDVAVGFDVGKTSVMEFTAQMKAGVGVQEAANLAWAAGQKQLTAYSTGLGLLAKVGKFTATAIGSLVLAVQSSVAAYAAAEAAGSGMFMALIAGVRAFTAALIASPLGPIILAILALVAAWEAAKGIFGLFSNDLNKQEAKRRGQIEGVKAYNLAIRMGSTELQAQAASFAANRKAQQEYMKTADKGTAFASLGHVMFQPWFDWWKKFKHDFLQELAPAVAMITTLFSTIGAAIRFVANDIILPCVKMAGGAILWLMDIVNGIGASITSGLLDVLQPIVEAIYNFVNAIRIAFAIFTSDKSPAEKMKLFGKLLVAFAFEAVKSVISIFFALVTGVIRILVGLVNVALKYIIEPFVHSFIDLFGMLAKGVIALFDGMVNGFLWILKQGINSIFWLVNKAIDGINFLLPKAMALKHVSIGDDFLHIDFGSLYKGIDTITSEAKKFVDTFQLNADDLTRPIDDVKDKMIGMIKAVQDKYGLNLSDIAKDAGVDLLKAPDLKKAWADILAKIKLKLDTNKLQGSMNDLADMISRINDKDIHIEINPLIQINVTKNVNADEAQAIIVPIIDKAFKEGAKGVVGQIYAATV